MNVQQKGTHRKRFAFRAVGIASCAVAAVGVFAFSQAGAQAAQGGARISQGGAPTVAPAPASAHLALVNQTKSDRYPVYSLRDLQTGQCLTGTAPGRTNHWANVTVDPGNPPHFKYYSGRGCQSNTDQGDLTGFQTAWPSGPDSSGFVTIKLIEP